MEWAAQGSGGTTILGNVQKPVDVALYRHGLMVNWCWINSWNLILEILREILSQPESFYDY